MTSAQARSILSDELDDAIRNASNAGLSDSEIIAELRRAADELEAVS